MSVTAVEVTPCRLYNVLLATLRSLPNVGRKTGVNAGAGRGRDGRAPPRGPAQGGRRQSQARRVPSRGNDSILFLGPSWRSCRTLGTGRWQKQCERSGSEAAVDPDGAGDDTCAEGKPPLWTSTPSKMPFRKGAK